MTIAADKVNELNESAAGDRAAAAERSCLDGCR